MEISMSQTLPRIFDGEIEGPVAWKRADLRTEDWLLHLPQPALDEISRVVDTLRRQAVPTLALRPDSFAMPACRAVMAKASAMLRDGARIALVRGMPMAEMSDEEGRAIFWMLSAMIARPVAQKLDGTIIYDVTDTGAKPLPGSGVRPDKSNIDLQFHNDNAYNALMPEVVGLLCIRPAVTGGLSRAMSFATAHNALRRRHADILPRLYLPFLLDRQREHRADEPPVFQAPVFERHGDGVAARLGLHQVRNGYAMSNIEMDAPTRQAIAAVEEVFRDPDLQTEFMMEAGDMQFAANREIGHSRTEFHDNADPARKRLLIRLWLRDEGAPGYLG
jgi:hypothetical protein